MRKDILKEGTRKDWVTSEKGGACLGCVDVVVGGNCKQRRRVGGASCSAKGLIFRTCPPVPWELSSLKQWDVGGLLNLSCGQNLRGWGRKRGFLRSLVHFVPSFDHSTHTYCGPTLCTHGWLGGMQLGSKQVSLLSSWESERTEEWVINEITTEMHVNLLQSRWYGEVIFSQRRDSTKGGRSEKASWRKEGLGLGY